MVRPRPTMPAITGSFMPFWQDTTAPSVREMRSQRARRRLGVVRLHRQQDQAARCRRSRLRGEGRAAGGERRHRPGDGKPPRGDRRHMLGHHVHERHLVTGPREAGADGAADRARAPDQNPLAHRPRPIPSVNSPGFGGVNLGWVIGGCRRRHWNPRLTPALSTPGVEREICGGGALPTRMSMASARRVAQIAGKSRRGEKSMRLLRVLVGALPLLALAAPALAQQGKPVKVALIEDKTGPLEAYAKQMVTGFRMGLEYATHGTNTVAGRKIEIIEKDSQIKPDLGRNLLERGLRRRQRGPRHRRHLQRGGAGHAAGGAGLQEGADRRRRGGRQHHRREVEPLHLPRRSQFLAGRDLQRAVASASPAW